MIVKFARTNESAVPPKLGSSGAGAFDLTANSIERSLTSGIEMITYGTGIAVEIPEGYVGLIFPRSSIRKTGLILSNSVGVIDSDYRGEIKATFLPTSDDEDAIRPYNIGDRCCQLMIIPVPSVEYLEEENLSDTERGCGGFGSTGR